MMIGASCSYWSPCQQYKQVYMFHHVVSRRPSIGIRGQGASPLADGVDAGSQMARTPDLVMPHMLSIVQEGSRGTSCMVT